MADERYLRYWSTSMEPPTVEQREIRKVFAELDAARAGLQQLRASAENVLAHTCGTRDGFALVQVEYVEALRRCVQQLWGFNDTPAKKDGP